MGLSVTVAAGFVALLLLGVLIAIGANRQARQPVNRFAPTYRRPPTGRRRTNDPIDGTSASPWIYSSAFDSSNSADCAPDAGSSGGADCGSSDGGGGGGGD